MHGTHGWFLNTRTVWIVLSVWSAAVLLYAFWRSRGDAKPDPLRESGPIL